MSNSRTTRKMSWVPAIAVLIGFAVNFIYAKEIALFNIVFNTGSYYKEIKDIPTLFPLLISLSTAICIISHKSWLTTSSKKDIYICISMLIIPIMTMGRGIFMYTFMTLIFQAIYFKGKIRLSNIKIYAIYALIPIVIFSVWGQIRSSSNEETNSSNQQLLKTLNELAEVTPDFEESIFPDAALWPYIYAVSPLANFDNALLRNYRSSSSCDLIYIPKSLLPESIQKNIGIFEENLDGALISPIFNVSTGLILPYYYCGVFGVISFIILLLLVLLFCLFATHKTSFHVCALSQATTILTLMLFANVFILDVVFIPLVVTVLYSIKERYVGLLKYQALQV